MKRKYKDDDVLTAVARASNSMERLISNVDPGHVQMLKLLRRKKRILDNMFCELEYRFNRESGG